VKRYLAVLIFAWPVAALADDACLSKYTKTDVCAFARKMQAGMAPSLPMVISSNVTISTVLAIGPRVVFNAVWSRTNAEIDAEIVAAGLTRSRLTEMMAEMSKNWICGSKVPAAFVRLGGEVQYTYKTMDGFPVASPLITDCP
jgi:hypothetical protein